jgi:hypothetical protein
MQGGDKMTVFPLVISWFLTFGYVPTMSESVNGSAIHLDQSRIATVAQIGLSASTEDDLFTIYTDIENFQYAPDGNNGASFSPFRINYSIGLEIKPNDNIRFNIDHQCDHPTTSKTSGILGYRYNSEITTISVTLSGKTRLFGGE